MSGSRSTAPALPRRPAPAGGVYCAAGEATADHTLGGRHRLIRLDRFEAVAMDHSVQLELDFVADFMAEQGLGHRRKVADDVFLRIRIPGSQDGELLGLVGGEVGGWTIVPMLATSVRAVAKSVPRARTAASPGPLCGASGASAFPWRPCIRGSRASRRSCGPGQSPRVGGDLLLHQFAVFDLAPLQAFPGDQPGRFLPGLLAEISGCTAG